MISVIPVVFLLVSAHGSVITEEKGSNQLTDKDLLVLMELYLFLYKEHLNPVNRTRRHQGYCGNKLPPRIQRVCNGSCAPGADVDIATVCCATKCSDDYIKTTCCPARS